MDFEFILPGGPNLRGMGPIGPRGPNRIGPGKSSINIGRGPSNLPIRGRGGPSIRSGPSIPGPMSSNPGSSNMGALNGGRIRMLSLKIGGPRKSDGGPRGPNIGLGPRSQNVSIRYRFGQYFCAKMLILMFFTHSRPILLHGVVSRYQDGACRAKPLARRGNS